MVANSQGLTSLEAGKKLIEYGRNVLPEKPPPSLLMVFFSQLKNPLVYILIFAGAVSFLLGDVSDGVIILLAVLINSVLGFFQESKADRSLSSLKKMLVASVWVLRDSKKTIVDLDKIVPGDICILSQGDKVPADGEIVSANRLHLSEAMLTGESVPVAKSLGDSIFMGTIVASGEGRMLVSKTGGRTEMGKIARQLQSKEELTPLQEQLAYFSKQLSIFVFGLTVVVFVVGLLTGKELLEIFKTSVALAVSAIPEGLLVGLTVVLAVGMQRILKKKGLVRNLVSAETLGGVTTICVDKTGTLTLGELQIEKVIGDEAEIAVQMVNTPDDPIVISASKWLSRRESADKLPVRSPRLDSIPFSPENRYFASLNAMSDCNVSFVNGAPEGLVERSNLESDEKEKLISQIESLTSEGRRVIGLARRTFGQSKKSLTEKDLDEGLEWIGMLVFTDPVRLGVKEALASAHNAGIKIMLITGDFAQTALAVIKELGLSADDKIITGEELEKLSASELAQLLTQSGLRDKRTIQVFARTRPEQKLKVVESLKAIGQTVAMMGDGVNDAPALKQADIGIVVGEATDVAKESADMVLLDSSFATIIEAIREGRGIFDNIRKIILYLMSDAFEEIIAVVGTIVLSLIFMKDFPLPVTAAQILWINLISDGFPHLALTVDPKLPGIMNRPPRKTNEKIVAGWMKSLILITSVIGGILALSVFAYFYHKTGDITLARSVTFATLGVNSLFYVFSVRTLKDPFWLRNPFDNKWLNFAVVGGLILQIAPFLSATTRGFLGLSALHFSHWTIVVGSSAVVFVAIEMAKLVFRQDALPAQENTS